VTRILLVDDHEIVRAGIKLMLKSVENIEIVGEASSGEDAINLARELKPDIILMDVNMPGIGGVEATIRLLRNDSNVKILIISSHDDDFLPARLLSIGASGYLTKQAKSEEMIEAIKCIERGNTYIDASLMNHIILPRFANQDTPSPFADFNERELQVLLMVARGIETDEIAQKLFLSTKTINGYRSSILKKLGVKTDVEATRIAIKHGLIDADSQWH
jgi:two-component system, NarL family, invasion response regulator UvrY